MKLWPRTIKSKQLLLSLCLAVLPLLAASYFVHNIATDIIRTNVENKLRQITLDKVEAIYQWMRERQADITLLETSEEVSNFYAGPGKRQHREEFVEFFEFFAQQYGTYSLAVLLGRNNQPLLVHPADLADPSRLDSFAATGGRMTISEAIKLDGAAHILITMPVTAGPREVGDLRVAVRLEMLNRITDNMRVGQTGEAYIVDNRGYFITHRKRELVLQENYTHVPIIQRLISGEEREFTGEFIDYRGIPVLGSYSYMPEFGWGVVAEQDVAEALQPVHRFTRFSLAITVVTMLVALLTASFIASRNLKPLNKLQNTIESIEAGNLNTRFEVSSDDEINNTGRLFNAMLDELEQIRSQLLQKVEAADKDLQRAHSELLNRHEELKLAQERLLHSERLSTMGEIAAGLAHEINNPLSTISMLIYSLQGDVETDEEERGKLITIIAEEISKIAGMIERFQNLTQPVTIEKEPVVIERVIDRALTLVRPRLESAGISCEVNISDHLPLFQGDERHLGQMMLNLLLNSIGAMPEGGSIRIVVEPLAKAGGQDWISLRVADTGEGISGENLEKVFKPFFTTKAEGTGLGLLNVRNIVDQHGGQISLESEPGAGTEITILFPVGE